MRLIRRSRLPALQFVEGSGWCNGEILSYDGSYYRVTFEDGHIVKYNNKEMSLIAVSPELAKVKIGSRVAVLWPDDDKFYEATVTQERNNRRPLHLVYDDGKCEWIDLRQQNFRLLKVTSSQSSDTYAIGTKVKKVGNDMDPNILLIAENFLAHACFSPVLLK